jgi:hypothetical protein
VKRTKRRVSVDLSGVNWTMLRQQKEILIQIRDDLGTSAHNALKEATLSGIIHLIDHIQDQAAEQLPMKEVFETDP